MSILSPFVGLNTATNTKDEKIIDYQMVGECRTVVRKHPQALKCLETIWNRLFKYGIQITVDGDQAKLNKATLDHINRHFIPFCKDFMQCYYEVGVVPVSISTKKDGHKVPIVMSDLGVVTVGLDAVSNRGKEFTFYKMSTKKNALGLYTPKKDKNTYIFCGYGYDPLLDGSIISPIASVIPLVRFTGKILTCAYKAEERNTQPDIYTEVVEQQVMNGEKAMGTSVDVNMWFGDKPRAFEDGVLDKITYNRQQIKVAEQMNNIYAETWNKSLAGGFMSVKPNSEVSKPGPMQLTPLPIGHRVASGVPRPIGRGDLLDILYREEEVISSIFGTPRGLFTSDSRTVAGTEANTEILAEQLMAWRKRLSDVMTVLFKCIYIDDICDLFEDDIKHEISKARLIQRAEETPLDIIKELRSITEKVAGSKDINVQLPVIPYENSNDLYVQFQRGVITYSEFVVYTKMALGLEVNEDDKEAEPEFPMVEQESEGGGGGGVMKNTKNNGEVLITRKKRKKEKKSSDTNKPKKKKKEGKEEKKKEGKEEKKKEKSSESEKKKQKT